MIPHIQWCPFSPSLALKLLLCSSHTTNPLKPLGNFLTASRCSFLLTPFLAPLMLLVSLPSAKVTFLFFAIIGSLETSPLTIAYVWMNSKLFPLLRPTSCSPPVSFPLRRPPLSLFSENFLPESHLCSTSVSSGALTHPVPGPQMDAGTGFFSVLGTFLPRS